MDTPDFYCLCGYVHVLTGAKWIGLVGTAAYTFGLVLRIVEPIVVYGISVHCYLTVILLSTISLLLALLAWFQTIVHRAYCYMRIEQHTLIPPQLHPAFVLTKTKLGFADPHQLEEGQEQQRESRLA
uniref:Transmembrane protein n=1 Tax=Globodera pallida TaxID=36090 RepID=A0A183CMB0_GLOPA